MSLWHARTPTIAKVRGFAVAGGSDIALACDIVVMAEDAEIGYPPARVPSQSSVTRSAAITTSRRGPP